MVSTKLVFSPVSEAIKIPSYPLGLKGFSQLKEKTRVIDDIKRFKGL